MTNPLVDTKGRTPPWRPVTQVGDAAERAMALQEGADDYLDRPFAPYELVARTQAALRRMLGDDPDEPRYIETVRGEGDRFVGLAESRS